MAVNTLASNFSADVSTFIAAKLLILAQKSLTMYQLCDHSVLPKNEGRVIQYTRYERVDLPQSTLTEGVTPGDTSMAISTVQATMDQWGAVIPISDVAIDSVKHPVLQQAIQLAALQAKETVDREISKVLLTGTNVFFANSAADRVSLVAGTDEIDGDDLARVTAQMRTDGAMTREDGMYLGVVHPYTEEDLVQDPSFVNVARYNDAIKLYNQEIGTWKGVRWIRSNFLPSIGRGAAPVLADGGIGGSLTGGNTHDVQITIVDKNTGFETHVSDVTAHPLTAGQSELDVTLPALPASATAGSTFNIYVIDQAVGSIPLLESTGGVAGNTVTISNLDGTGAQAPNASTASFNPPFNADANGARVYFTWFFARQGVICTELNKMKAYLTPAVPSDSDPLVQRRKVGWKLDFKTVISNEQFLARLEHLTTNGS